jgi:hypothetical protein
MPFVHSFNEDQTVSATGTFGRLVEVESSVEEISRNYNIESKGGRSNRFGAAAAHLGGYGSGEHKLTPDRVGLGTTL